MNAQTINNYLRDIQILCDSNATNKEVSDYFSEISEKCPSLYYNNFILWLVIIVSLVSPVLVYYSDKTIDPKYLIIGPVIAVICGVIIRNRSNRINLVIESLTNLYNKNLLNVRQIPIKRGLKNMFFEFSRGNHSNKIIQASRSNDNSFDLVRYNWVNKRYVTETRTNKNGEDYTVERVYYEDFYQDGIIIQTNIYDNICIQSSKVCGGGKTWTTAYEQFNKKFTIKCDNEIAAAKVLTPPVVLKIYESSKIVNELNIELRDSGFALISFPSNILHQPIQSLSPYTLSSLFKTQKHPILDPLSKLVKTREILEETTATLRVNPETTRSLLGLIGAKGR